MIDEGAAEVDMILTSIGFAHGISDGLQVMLDLSFLAVPWGDIHAAIERALSVPLGDFDFRVRANFPDIDANALGADLIRHFD